MEKGPGGTRAPPKGTKDELEVERTIEETPFPHSEASYDHSNVEYFQFGFYAFFPHPLGSLLEEFWGVDEDRVSKVDGARV
jgi:hypothetical protein